MGDGKPTELQISEFLARLGVPSYPDLLEGDLDFLWKHVAGENGFVRPLIAEIRRHRARVVTDQGDSGTGVDLTDARIDSVVGMTPTGDGGLVDRISSDMVAMAREIKRYRAGCSTSAWRQTAFDEAKGVFLAGAEFGEGWMVLPEDATETEADAVAAGVADCLAARLLLDEQELAAHRAMVKRLEAWAAQLDASATEPGSVGPFIAAELRNRMRQP